MKNEKGITLIVLIIIVLLMAILIGATVASGTSSLKTVRLQNYNYELQQVQGQTDIVHEKMKKDNSEDDYITLNGITIGRNITDSTDAVNALIEAKGIDYSNISTSNGEYYYSTYTYYRYLSEDTIKKLFNIDSNPGDMIINFKTREVISVKGFEFEGKIYYSLNDFKS